MWKFASKCLAGSFCSKSIQKQAHAPSECSDDDSSSVVSRDEGLECLICYESFNIVENVPYVLWCGHTLCKNCILGLQWAVVKFPTLPIQLPLFISCPWCSLMSLRLVYKGDLKVPRKNYFLLSLVESKYGERDKSSSVTCDYNHPRWPSVTPPTLSNQINHNIRRECVSHHSEPSGVNLVQNVSNYMSLQTIHSSLQKALVFLVHLMAKFPLIIIFLLIIAYAIPASAAILAVYILITVLFALPSFLILYFSYPSLDWLVREIIT